MATMPLAQRVRTGETFVAAYAFSAPDIAEFAARAADRNPVHHDAEAGARSRFGTRIAAAEQTISLMMGLAASWLAERGTAIGLGCSFRFTAAVREGDRLELRWTVAQAYYKESLDGVIVVFEGVATNQEGRVAMKGSLEMLLQD